MAWIEWVFTLLMAIATIRAITTALRKESEGRVDGGITDSERLILREDMEHWWTAVLINAILFSVGVAALFTVNEVDANVTFVDRYLTYCFLAVALLLNVRIERHGYYYRRRNNINFWGKPRDRD
jgi:hypothetical protein